MRAPSFWTTSPPTVLATLLRPLGAIYGAVAARRLRQPAAEASLPVICIGNFTAGGAGKTPTALAAAQVLAAAGHRPVFLTRGYGGRLAGPLLVSPASRAADVGDEPLLLARTAPTIVAQDRVAGARLAQSVGDVVIMDDGLQNPTLAKDVSVAVVDGGTGIGNGLCLPAGPLRAPIDVQWSYVQAVLVIGPGAAGEAVATDAARRGRLVLRGHLVPDPADARRLAGQRVLAFAGIGRPAKFFDTLRALGAVLEREIAFPDHHAYEKDELVALLRDARLQGLRPVTTEKDAVRLGPDIAAREIDIVKVSVALDDPEAFRALITGAATRAASS
jgi:tetraacyldisaccharide 4'-kinase